MKQKYTLLSYWYETRATLNTWNNFGCPDQYTYRGLRLKHSGPLSVLGILYASRMETVKRLRPWSNLGNHVYYVSTLVAVCLLWWWNQAKWNFEGGSRLIHFLQLRRFLRSLDGFTYTGGSPKCFTLPHALWPCYLTKHQRMAQVGTW